MNDGKQAALSAIQKINAVEGFDPTPLAVEYVDLNTQEKRSRLPVMAQLAWFRLKYPEGRVSVAVTAAKDCFVATARVYPSYTNPPEQYLSEATASRGYQADKPTVSPREWAQTAAIGIALRNAGFGLQFSAAGDSFDSPLWTSWAASSGAGRRTTGSADGRHAAGGCSGGNAVPRRAGGSAGKGHEHALSHQQVQGQNAGTGSP